MDAVRGLSNLLIYVNIGSEMIYILNNRIKSLELEDSKRLSILQQIAGFLYKSEDNIKHLREQKQLITIDSLYAMLNQVCQQSVITLDNLSFQKMVEMILMALKKDLMLMRNDYGIISITINHLECVERIVGTTHITVNLRKSLQSAFDDLTAYSFFMIKRDMLNYLLFKHSKISIYMRDNIQALDGHFIVRQPKLGGFNCEPTGTIRTWPEGKVVAEKTSGLKTNTVTKFKVCYSYKHEENDKLGCDLFENLKKNELVIVDKEYLSKIQSDFSNKIIGSGSGKSKIGNDKLSLDFDFDVDQITNQSPGKNDLTSHKDLSMMSEFGSSKPQSNQGKTKFKGLLDDNDDDILGKDASKVSQDQAKISKFDKSAGSKITGSNLLSMMDDL